MSERSLRLRFARRILDAIASFCALLILAPLLAAVAVLILLEDGRPVVFGQERVGLAGNLFRILKFRTMRKNASGTPITVAGDRRVTRVGAKLRRFKVDELLQLLNVLKGDMSFCGPRPEIPLYVRMDDPVWQAVLLVPPGITDPASLVYRYEEEVLAQAPDPEEHYRNYVLPHKLRMSLQYLQQRTWWSDLKLIVLTARYSFVAGPVAKDFIEQELYGKNQ